MLTNEQLKVGDVYKYLGGFYCVVGKRADNSIQKAYVAVDGKLVVEPFSNYKGAENGRTPICTLAQLLAEVENQCST